jgi:DNA-binding CsgD family transcriptional regulator
MRVQRMTRHDELLSVIATIHAAGLDPQSWSPMLGAVTRLVGGVAGTLEIVDKRTLAHRAFHGFNVPRADEIRYLAGFVTNSPRWTAMMPRQKSGDVGCDYQFIDERGMNASPFYGDFLARMEMRYFVVGVLAASDAEYTAVTVQRTPRQGHPDRAEIALMRRLVPHVRQAFDLAGRLAEAAALDRSLMRALDLVADGVALVRADGAVVHANAAFQAIARRGDGIAIRNGMVDFADAPARARFADAIAGIYRLRAGETAASQSRDLPARRPSGLPAYVLSVRPLVETDRVDVGATGAVAIVFAHDPTRRKAAAIGALREAFGLTEAEAALALALQAGGTPAGYAATHGLSLNTVYTHMRRLREKTRCTRMPELIRRLDDLGGPAQPDRRSD